MRSALAWLAVCLIVLSAHPAVADNDWLVSLYGGQFSGARNGDVIAARVQDSYVGGLGVLWQWEKSPPYAIWESEVVWLQHFGRQHHQEFAASIGVRWVAFPWNAYLDTSLAFGSGVSYATEVPELENRENPETGSNRFLHYIMLETALGVPGTPQWSIAGRIHHRSGVFGLFDGVGRASNIYMLGLRYRF